MQAAFSRTEQALHDLEAALKRRTGSWLHGEDVTLADVFWAVELLRMKNMGVAKFWEQDRLPQVAGYAVQIETLPAVRSAVLEWPGALF